jgi:hypothetical protein
MSINFDQRYIDFNLARDYPPAPPEEQSEEMPMMEDVQLAAGPSGTVSDAGAAFGVFPQMKPRRGGRSDIGERVITGAPDFAAGTARGAATAALGFGGDIQKIGRFISALATDNQGGSITDRLGRAALTMENPTFLPSSEDVSKGGYTIPGTNITLPGLPPAVPAGQAGFGMTPEQRQSAAEAGQFTGELVGDPFLLGKAAGATVQAGQGVARMAGQELNRAILEGTGPLASVVPQSARPLGMVGNDVSYRGSHTAPRKSDDVAAPGHDLTGGGSVYPQDVYSANGPRYYGDGSDLDRSAFAIINSIKGNPNAEVNIYRAVPKEETNAEKLISLEKDMAAYMRRGKLPDNAFTTDGNKWYNWAYSEKQLLSELPDEPIKQITKINPGDWVTITRQYAKDHGDSVLQGKYKIISKKVKASEIFTNGDSIQEWGYDPAEKGTK